MELRLLRYFVAVAEELNFSRAAKRLYIAQPPLSHQIRQLEAEIGVELFTRDKRHVELTLPGRQFLASARAILNQAEAAVSQAQAAARGEIGELTIGLVGTALYDENIPATLRHFRQQFPKVSLVLRYMSIRLQLRALHEKRIDLGILRLPVHDPDLWVQRVSKDLMVAVLPSAHPLAGRPSVSLSDLSQDCFITIMRQAGQALHDQSLKLCIEAGFSPQIAFRVSEIHQMVGLVSAGLGVSLVPSTVKNFHPTGVWFAHLDGVEAYTEIAAAYLRNASSPALRSFLEVLATISGKKDPHTS